MDGSIIDMLTFKRTKNKQSASIFSAPCFSLLFLNCGPLWWPLQALCVQKIANVSISPLCCRQSIHHSCTLQRTRMVGGGLPDCRVWLQDIITTYGEYFVFYGQMEPTMYVHWTYICVSVYVHMHIYPPMTNWKNAYCMRYMQISTFAENRIWVSLCRAGKMAV